jgi:hypothetical protein
MISGQPVLTEKVPVVCDEEETSRSPMDFGIRCVSLKPSQSLPFPDLAKASQITEAFGHVGPHVVI